MRAFIVLAFFVAAGSATIAEIPGYQYGPGSSGVLVKPGAVVGSASVVQPVSTLAAPLVTTSIGSGIIGGSTIVSPAKTVVSSGPLLTGGSLIGGSIVSPAKTVVTSGQLLSGGGLVGGSIVSPAKTVISSGPLLGGGSLVGGTIVSPGKTIVSSGPLLGGGSLVGGSILSPASGVLTSGQLLSGGGLVQPSTTILGGGVSSVGNTIIAPGRTTVIGIDAVDSIPQTVEYNKQVFYFQAPEEVQNEGIVTQQLSNILKKNLQVVFIKAPENQAATNAALQLAKQAIEQRTAIYVLSKENDASQIVGQLQQIQENVQTVPEVRIVKYRTQQDLINAQASIQAQYDNFGGPTGLINGGVVPVLNYASGVGVLGTGNLLASKVVDGTIYAPNSRSYLPPLKK